MPNYTIPCVHETQGLPITEKVADYHPLTVEELRELLTIARSAIHDVQVDICCRIEQAIPGMTCPSPMLGPVAELDAELLRVYTDWSESSDPVESVMDRIAALLSLVA